jgi:alkanesulfonate monooxygenase SsuD/methylene tetrahydromethanopterin reductase-like flavin-dependent oxidoreductase (luciferase family)
MRFSLIYEAQVVEVSRESDHRIFREIVEQVDLAEEMGFDVVWAVEHTALNQYANKTKVEDFLNKEDCPVGRRYWVITEASRASGMPTSLPTERAKDTFRIENTVSNKFTLASFVL